MSSALPRITDIRSIGLGRGWSAESGDDEGGTAHTRSANNSDTLLEVHTDAGLVGYGSCYTTKDLVDAALGFLRPMFRGEVAIEPERVAEKMHQYTYWQGRGGAITHAISGIDIALWDILGKFTGQPVGRLLGGRYRDKIKPYGSLIFAEPDKLRDVLQAAMARGFRAFKLGWGPFGRVSDALDEEMISTARETVGDDCELMVDAGGSQQFWPHGIKWALRTAEMLAEYDVVWLEEALPPDDMEGFRELRLGSSIFISTGECLTRRQVFRPWLESGAVDIIQPDCTKVGGLSEARRIGWMAYDHNILMVPHGWNTAIGLAADLQLVSAMPNARWVEYITPAPLIDGIVAEPIKLDEQGFVTIPDGPGLGIELSPEKLKEQSI